MKKVIFSFVLWIMLFGICKAQWVSLNSGTSMNLNCVQFINAQTGFVVGAGSAFRKTTNGGINWIPLDPFGALELRSVYFFDANTGLICGYGGTIIKTTDGGVNFRTINSGTSTELLSLSFYNSFIGVCSGNSGTILYTTNGGENWLVSYPTGYMVTFYSSFMISATDGYSVGVNTIFSPLVAKTSNGGANWTYSSFMVNNNEATLYDAHFFNVQNGIAISNLWNGQGGISSTTNGGLNWTSQICPYGLFGMDFPLPNIGYCVGNNGYILKSTDGGVSWVQQVSNTTSLLRSVDFVDSLNGYAAGAGGAILKTTNGGITGYFKTSSDIPKSFHLYQNYPNPFNPTTKIKFSLPLPSKGGVQEVSLKIYDILGKQIASLIPPLWGEQEGLPPGTYEVEWNATNYPSGVYFYKLITKEYTETKKLILLK